MNVIPFTRKSSLECLPAGRDGYFIAYLDEHGAAQHTVGRFSRLNDARRWATANAAGVTFDWLSFFVLGRPFPSAGQSLNAKPATGVESK